MTELVPVPPLPDRFDNDEGSERQALQLVAQWLAEFTGNSRSTYADAIGWPFTATAKWRGYGTVRNGVSWLAWCYMHDLDLFAATRLHALAWIDAVHASRHPVTGRPLERRNKALMASAASSFYTWAFREGHAESNPIAALDRNKQGINPAGENSGTRSLSKAEAHAMLTAADNDPVEASRQRTAAIISLLMTVGPRVSEGICNTVIGDMYVQDGRRVLHTVLKGSREHLYPLPSSVCRRIDAYLASRADLRNLPVPRGESGNANTPLFATSSGMPISRREVWALVRRIAELAGIDRPDKVHPHVGRHTVATEIRRQNGTNQDVQNHFGHRFESTSARYGEHIIKLERSPIYGVADAFENYDGQ